MQPFTGFTETVQYLYEKLPMFSRVGKAALKPDLTNTIRLCTALGNPHLSFRSVHIAGTNGKGSVSHSLAAVMQQAGYKTGLYTSPHLVDFRERIRINGKAVSQQWVIDFVNRIRPLIDDIQPSFFEITVAMAFTLFAEEKVDIAIIETGLGGRLDSTNIITPLLSVITNISFDHKDLLGDTLAAIAAEKAGIIKHGIPTVIGEQQEETERVFFEHSVQKQSVLHYAQSLWGMVRVGQDVHHQYYKAVHNGRLQMYDLRTDLMGNYQQHNIKTILTAVELLAHQGFKVSIDIAIQALAHVRRLTGLRGRWDILQASPLIVADVAHNPAGVTEVMAQFGSTTNGRMHIVLGFVKDKDVASALSLLPSNAIYYFTNAAIERVMPATTLRDAAIAAGLQGDAYTDVATAVAAARASMQSEDVLLITGSFFIVGEALPLFPNAATV
jgi:dihydrofolate synthase/folylpolyglutamate synthase